MRDNLRIWVLGAVLVGGAVLAGGWFVGVQPLLAAAADNESSTQQAETQNEALQVRLLKLQAAQRNIGALRVTAARVGQAIPTTVDAQSFVNRVNLLAAQDDVKVAAITPGDPMAYAQPDSSEGKLEAFVSPQISAANLAVIPVTVQVTGSVKNARTFLGDVQHDSRLFLVNGVTIAASSTGTGTVATFSGYIYALKATDGGS